MLKKMTLFIGQMNLQFKIEEEKIPELVNMIFGIKQDIDQSDLLCVSDYFPEDKQTGEKLWARKSTVVAIGTASTANIQVPKVIINPQQIPNA